jgi:CheY-like chemotaxis protein
MNKPLVLVVEDDRPVRNLIVTTLKAHDYRYLFFWVNDLVRSVTQKKFLLHITLGTGYN